MRTTKMIDDMSTLKELCSVIPAELLRQQAQYNAQKRSAASYCKRIASLGVVGEGAYKVCKESRPSKKRVQVKHEFSCGSAITVKRMGRTTVVCRTKIY